MADILSQDEISRLLDTSIGDSEWPLYFYTDQPQVMEISREFAVMKLDFVHDQDIYETDIKIRLEKEFEVKVNIIFHNKKQAARYFIEKLEEYEKFQKQADFLKEWLENNPEYII